MNPSSLAKALRIIRPTKRPVMIWGKPGVGKSNIVEQDAAAASSNLLDWWLALKDPVDLMGTPFSAKHEVDKQPATYWAPPADLPREGDWTIFMDELPQARVETTNAATQLILDRRLGSYKLPESAWIVAAGNREEDRAASNRMPSHVANRFIHLTLDVHTDDWLAWAERSDIDPAVMAFLKYRREFLHTFDPRSTEKAFASPRSWAFCSQVIKQVALDREARWAADEQMELVAGIVGKQAAVEFVGFLRIMEKLVSIDQILLHPLSAPVPEDAAIIYALVYALADRADRKLFAGIVQYVERLKSKEFAFLFMRQISLKKPDLQKTKAFIDWSAKNQDFI